MKKAMKTFNVVFISLFKKLGRLDLLNNYIEYNHFNIHLTPGIQNIATPCDLYISFFFYLDAD